jgi:signal transduction histidine kinase
VTLWRRWRADLARPEVPTSREALGFLVGTAVVIVVAAQLTDPGSALDLIALAPAVAAFVLRGLVPRLPAEVFAVMVIVSVTVAVGRDGALEGAFFLGVMMVFNTASHLGSLTRALVITGVAVTLPWVVAEQLVPESGITWEPWVLANVFIFTLGRAVYRQGRLIEQLEQARRALADQEVAEERRRIARELHDLAGHTLAAMLLHVTGARHVLRRDLAEAERALIDAEMVGRASLDQIRATVASLRADERGTDPALAGVADVATLVDEYRRAGLVVESTVDESAAAVTGPLGVAVHRVAREALANVARHAPDNRVELRVDWMGDGVRLLVLDHGRPAAPPDGQGLHFGLVGMAERTRSLGGRFDAGPTADGWRLEAYFPNAVADQFVSS